MRDNRFTPSDKGANENKLQSNNTPIKRKKHGTLSSVQRACLRFLLDNPDSNRWELVGGIGRGYAPDVVQYLRRKGIQIITDMRKVNGKNRPIGFYTIAPESVDKAREMVGLRNV